MYASHLQYCIQEDCIFLWCVFLFLCCFPLTHCSLWTAIQYPGSFSDNMQSLTPSLIRTFQFNVIISSLHVLISTFINVLIPTTTGLYSREEHTSHPWCFSISTDVITLYILDRESHCDSPPSFQFWETGKNHTYNHRLCFIANNTFSSWWF